MGGCGDQAAGLPEDTWGRRGGRRRKGGRACSSRGSPCQPWGSRNLAGQPQTPHWPRGKNGPTFQGRSPGSRKREGGLLGRGLGVRLSGSESVFARVFWVTLWALRVSGGDRGA